MAVLNQRGTANANHFTAFLPSTNKSSFHPGRLVQRPAPLEHGTNLTPPLPEALQSDGLGRLSCLLAEPRLETRLAEPRVIAGDQRPLAHLNAVVARMRVSDNLARVLACR